ncbi:MAG: CCA tRNA nucleotidyltransferase [Kiritimatiellia bacterium]|nr:CCA tRNA nucleotidyltransferase [Kiritimatiellia bacterium]
MRLGIANSVAERVVSRLVGAGFSAWYVGGCVRDAILGRDVKDIDIATDASPEEVESLFAPHTVSVGKSFGVVVVLEQGQSFEVVTFRSDGCYIDGRRPSSVSAADVATDASRRDITINALYCNPQTGEVVDYVGGLGDCRNRVIRMIGDPYARLNEDKLRLLRVVRFASVLDFEIEPGTWSAVCALASRIGVVSVERIAKEVLRMLCESPRPSRALQLLYDSRLLHTILPEAVALRGCAQPPEFHPEGDVWRHTCLMLDELPAPRSERLALAVLLHDIGKPSTFSVDETGRIRFKCHAAVGARLAERILRRWKLPTALVERVVSVVREHMTIVEVCKMRPSRRRRWMGEASFPDTLELARLDLLHSTGDLALWRFAKASYEAFKSEPILPPPFLKGADLIAAGLRPGRQMGELLRRLYDLQLEGNLKSRSDALERLPSLLQELDSEAED